MLSSKEQLELQAKQKKEAEEAMKIKNFLATIQKLLGDKYEAFKVVFATYKKSMHPSIDEFTAEMFQLFFGHKELAVC
jgi:hypothetical protein